MDRWCLFAAATVLIGTLAGCHFTRPGPTGARMACTSSCESQHDRCIMAALNPPSVEYCDGEFAGCLRRCPPE